MSMWSDFAGLSSLVLVFALTAGCAKSSTPDGDPDGPCPTARDVERTLCGEFGLRLSPGLSEEYPDFLRGCEHFVGTVDYANYPIADVSPWETVEVFDGELNLFRNRSLTSLHGLERLEEIEDLTIRLAYSLDDFGPLRNLRRVRGRLLLQSLPLLQSLEGLERLECVGELNATVTEVTSLEGLRSLRRIEGDAKLWSSVPEAEVRAFFERVEVGGSIEVNGEVWREAPAD